MKNVLVKAFTLFTLVWMFTGPKSATAQVSVERGKEIFHHEWSPYDSNSPPKGDGLGPIFNGRSCVECHHQAGSGGGGDLEHNIDMVTVEQVNSIPTRRRLQRAHPAFFDENGVQRIAIIVHRFSVDPKYNKVRAEKMPFDGALAKSEWQKEQLQRAITLNPVQPIEFARDIDGIVVQRNTTALFGSGLIDKISNQTLVAQSRATGRSSKVPAISGRLSIVGRDQNSQRLRYGKFGWRGNVGSVTEFVAGACATEMGLANRFLDQPQNPRRLHSKTKGVDISDTDLASLIKFVQALPRPEQILPPETIAIDRVRHGQQLFTEIGCAECHVKDGCGIREVYSDFMLHDMGPTLSDPLPAPEARIIETILGTRFVGDAETVSNPWGVLPAFDDFRETANLATRQLEWRTPPLWGVADSAPYMHDGRAPTLVEAIALHGGESEQVTRAFFGMPFEDQLQMIEFLQTLKAPKLPQP